MSETRQRFTTIQIPKTEAGIAAKEVIDSVIASTRTTRRQQVTTHRTALTAWLVMAYTVEFAIAAAGGVENLGKWITERNAHDQAAITHTANNGE